MTKISKLKDNLNLNLNLITLYTEVINHLNPKINLFFPKMQSIEY